MFLGRSGSSVDNFPNAPYQEQEPFPLPSAILDDVTSVSGSGNGSCSWYRASGKLPISWISGQHSGKSPLAQVDQLLDLVTGRRLSGVSTSEPGDRSAIFFYCTIQHSRIAVQHSVIVGKNLMLFHQPRPHYDHFFFNSAIVNIRMPVLPPHELNRWEDLFYHHTELTAGRKLTSIHNSSTYQPPSQYRVGWFMIEKDCTSDTQNIMKETIRICKWTHCWLGIW